MLFCNRTMASRLCLPFLLLPLLSSCGGGGGGDKELAQTEVDAVEIGVPVAAVLAAEGGSLTLRSVDGSVMSLEVPADSLNAETPFSITQEEDGSFTLSPAGLHLVPPATLRLQQNADFDPLTHFAWLLDDEDVLIPTTVDGNMLEAQIGLWGLDSRTISVSFSAQSVSASAATPSPAPASIGLTRLECRERIDKLKSEFQSALSSDVNKAIAIGDELLVVGAQCTDTDVNELTADACAKFDTAQTNATILPVTSIQVFHELFNPLMSSFGHVIRLGADCPNDQEINATNDSLVSQLITVLRDEMNDEGFAERLTGRRLTEIAALESQCQLLGLPEVTCARMRTTLYPKILDILRAATYQQCLDGEGPLALAQLLAEDSLNLLPTDRFLDDRGNFSRADLEKDILNCTDPTLNLRVLKNVDRVAEEVTELNQTHHSRGNFNPAGEPLLINHDTTLDVSVPRSGALEINGTVHTPVCPAREFNDPKKDDLPPRPADDELVFRINETEISRHPAAGLFWAINNSPAEIVLARDLVAAGLDPINTNSFTLDAIMEGTGCLGVIETPRQLYRLNITVLPFELSVTPSAAEVFVDESVDFNALLDDQDTAQVNWSATGGSISDTGLFTAGGSAGTVTVTATLQDDPRITESATVTVRERGNGAFRLVGRVTVDYDFELGWNGDNTFCDFGLPSGQTCEETQVGSLRGNMRTEIDLASLGAVVANNVPASATMSETTGNLSGSSSTTGVFTSGECTRNSSSNGSFSHALTSGSGSNWFVNLNGETLFLGESIGGTALSFSGTVGPGSFSSSSTAACPEGSTSASGTNAANASTMTVRTPLGVFSGAAPQNQTTWTGSSTVRKQNELCSSFFNSSMFETRGFKWLSNSNSSCSLVVDISWELTKVPL